MVRKRSKSKKTPLGKRFRISLEPRLREEIVSLLLMAIGGITLLNLLSVTQAQGLLIDTLSGLLRQTFGWGAFLAALAMIALGVALLLRNLESLLEVRKLRLVGGLLLFFTLLGLLHFFYPDPLRVAQEGGGGGYFGWVISVSLYTTLGDIGSFLVLLVFLFVGAVLVTGISPREIGDRAAALANAATALFQDHVSPYLERLAQETGVREEPSPAMPLARPVMEKREEGAAAPSRAPTEEKPSLKRRKIPSDRLPSVDLLDEVSLQALGEAEVRRKLKIIEDTLSSFGVPAKVVEVNQGPTVTQFGVEPGHVERRGPDGQMTTRRVRVSKISSLSKDLALALAAAPIRIEAPVPGRPVVGIEVPNDDISLVALRGVMQSEEFQATDASLKIALGRNVSGRAVVAALDTMPHLLIAGATGSGKSVCINSTVTCLLFNNTPEQMKLLMIDPKTVEFIHFNGLPHLVAPVVTDMARVLQALRWVMAEMDRRYTILSQAAARNIEHYNSSKLKPWDEPLPYIVVAIDELADLMMMAPDEVERIICRLAQMARATGIHLVIATQRPSVDVVTGLIKANFPARISFAVTSQVDSRVVLDTGGAESLLGQGDMLYMAPDSAKLVRLQGCFVSDEEISRVVQFWSEAVPSRVEESVPPWGETGPSVGREEERDELLEEAIALLSEQRHASTSLLQRRLRIGYPRAARLMDQLEDEGIVGPPQAGGRRREVLVWEEDEVMYEDGEQL